MTPKLFLKSFLIVLASMLVCLKSQAALLPEDAQKMEESFLGSADMEAAVSLVKIENELFCGIKTALKATCRCTAVYQIQKIFKKPETLDLNTDDRLILNYPCDNAQQMNWIGSTISWAKPQKDGLLLMTIPSGYLKPIGARRWLLDNQGKIFGPIKPVFAAGEIGD